MNDENYRNMGRNTGALQTTPVMLVALVILVSCLAYLARAMLFPDNQKTAGDTPAVSSVLPEQGGSRPVMVPATATRHAVGSGGSIEDGRSAAEPSAALPLAGQNAGRDDRQGRRVSGRPVAGDHSTALVSGQAAEVGERQPAVASGSPVSSAPATLTGIGTAVSAPTTGETATTQNNRPAVDTRPVSEPEQGADSNASTDVPGAADSTGGYAEVTAEVQIDLDERQIIRCYPVDGDNSLPCMCEHTVIKEGNTQTEVVDNCQ